MSKEVKNLEHAEAAPIEELEELKAFWSKYGHYVCIALLVCVIIMFGSRWFKNKQLADIASAQVELNSANTPEELAAVVDNNRSSYVTPIAMLKLGAAYFSEQRYDEAILTYDDFISKFNNHALVDNAKFALATSYEVTGKFDEAISRYDALTAEGAFKQDATLGKARCLILKGSKQAGKEILDMFIADNAGKQIVMRAEALLSAIDRLENPAPKATTDLSNFFAAPSTDAAVAPAAEIAEAVEASAPATDTPAEK